LAPTPDPTQDDATPQDDEDELSAAREATERGAEASAALDALASRDPRAVSQAEATLVAMGNDSIAGVRAVLLNRRQTETRSAAARVLGHIGSADACTALLDAIGQGERALRTAIIDALGNCNAISIPVIERRLTESAASLRLLLGNRQRVSEDPSGEFARSVARTADLARLLGPLAHSHPTARGGAVAALHSALDSAQNFEIRVRVVRALGATGDNGATKPLIERAKTDPDEILRAEAVAALGVLARAADEAPAQSSPRTAADPSERKVLRITDPTIKGSPGPRVGRAAGGAPPREDAHVRVVESDPMQETHSTAETAASTRLTTDSLQAIGAAVADRLGDTAPRVRAAAVIVLARLPDQGQADALARQMRKDSWMFVRRDTAEVLGNRCWTSTLPALRALALDGKEDDDVRIAAMASLGSCKDAEAGQLFLDLVGRADVEPRLRGQACSLVGTTGRHDLLGSLLDRVRSLEQQLGGKPAGQTVMASCVRSVGALMGGGGAADTAAEQLLLKQLREPSSPPVQAAAAEAAGRSCLPSARELLAKAAHGDQPLVARAARAALTRCAAK
jgi:HEAT repeat protein